MLDKCVLIHDEQEPLHPEGHAISFGMEGNKTRQVYFAGDSEKLKDSLHSASFMPMCCVTNRCSLCG